MQLGSPGTEKWSGRPTAARMLRAGVFVAPIATSLGATMLLVQWLPAPHHARHTVVWWLALATLATGVLAISDRIARRLLPLAALLKLSLVFPERAPSRLRLALRAGDERRLQHRIDHVRRNGLGDTPARAAEELLEMVGLLDAHDRRTRGHSERVRAYTALIAREMRLSRADLNRLQWAALLHDVGKLFVPVEVLEKPGRLSDDEYQIVKRHPEWGADLVSPLVPWLGSWARAVGEHHERWDGAGYPRGLKGRDISLAARIVSVADAYDVMTSTRSYREGMSTVRARKELVRCSGTQFDPEVVRAFLRVSVGRLRPVAAPLTWLAQIPLLTPVAASAGPVGPAVVATSTVAGVSISASATAPAPAPAPDSAGAASPPPEAATVGPAADLPAPPAGGLPGAVPPPPATPTTAAPPPETTTTAPPAPATTASKSPSTAAPPSTAPASSVAPSTTTTTTTTTTTVATTPGETLPPATTAPPAGPGTTTTSGPVERSRSTTTEPQVTPTDEPGEG